MTLNEEMSKSKERLLLALSVHQFRSNVDIFYVSE